MFMLFLNPWSEFRSLQTEAVTEKKNNGLTGDGSGFSLFDTMYMFRLKIFSYLIYPVIWLTIGAPL